MSISYTNIYRDLPIYRVLEAITNSQPKSVPEWLCYRHQNLVFIAEAIKMLIRLKVLFLHLFLIFIFLEDLRILITGKDGQKHLGMVVV